MTPYLASSHARVAGLRVACTVAVALSLHAGRGKCGGGWPGGITERHAHMHECMHARTQPEGGAAHFKSVRFSRRSKSAIGSGA